MPKNLTAQEIVNIVKNQINKTSNNKVYTEDDFIYYNDIDFIKNAYKLILNREPDEAGMNYYLKHLRSGSRTKMQIITNIASSKEAKEKNIKIKNLFLYKIIFFIYKIPILSYIFKTLIHIATLPKTLKRLNHLENKYNTNIQELYQQIQTLNNQLNQQIQILNTKLKSEISLLDEKYSYINVANNIDTQKDSNNPKPINSNLKQSYFDNFYLLFEDKFRGSKEIVKEKLKIYLQYIKNQDFVLDIGCGRGEWLELLKENNINSKGIDINQKAINTLQKNNFNVINIDAIKYLQSQKNQTIPAITAFHIIEHFNFEDLLIFLQESFRVLTKQGIIILETPNPKNLGVGACNFYTDPTHKNPLPPHLTKFLLEFVGFKSVQIIPTQKFENIKLQDKALQNFVDEWINQSEDYAVIGKKY